MGADGLTPLLVGNPEAWIRRTFRGVSKKHMHWYLDEFLYRFNRYSRGAHYSDSSSAAEHSTSCSSTTD